MPVSTAPFAERPTSRRMRSPLRALFGCTILASACLLFLVQPMASKLILPWFGGSAAVWITCMLFFQAGLLLGYLYAHAVASKLRPIYQSRLHAALLIASLLVLPVVPNAAWQPTAGQDPTWRLLAVLAMCVGLPFFLLSSTSPLLQSWYAKAASGSLPYRYFALSNGGSLAALLAYPVLIEPRLSARQQAWLWSGAYAGFVVLCIATAFMGNARSAPNSAVLAKRAADTGQVRARNRTFWIALAACASTLLLCVTNMLTQNIAPMPLLWVLPLSIYLLTFILCFESDRWYKRFVFLPLVLPALGCLVACAGPLDNARIAVAVPVLCGALFVCSMACHGELARLRPPVADLTSFYLCVSIGGAAGGAFVAVIAPHLFSATFEYPIAFVATAVLLLAVLRGEMNRWPKHHLGFHFWMAGLAGTVLLAAYTTRQTVRDVRSATLLARNFYGSLRVDDFVQNHQRARELMHGTITHGIQFLSPALRHAPTTYYARDSGVGLAWRALENSRPLRAGVVGLGTGTLAAYGRAGDTLRFYEINPLVIEIARKQFRYLSDCPAHIDVVLGDARLSMSQEPSQQFDILVVDAFSGDAIPVHLLTREAFAIYWRHLKPDGVLVLHVSNRYLDLAPVAALGAKRPGSEAWQVDNEDDDRYEIYGSTYVLASSRKDFFHNTVFRGRLSAVQVPAGMKAWTDDFSNLWQVLDSNGSGE